MEIVRVITFVLFTFKISVAHLKNHIELERKMKIELNKLMKYLDRVKTDLEHEGWKSYDELLLTELVYDIDDFAQGLRKPGFSHYFRSAVGMNPREMDVERIKCFQDEIDKLRQEKQKSTESKPEQDEGSDPASSSAAGRYTPEESLVGISERKRVLLELLEKPASSEEAEKPPKVISIVGCPGVGKTALARAVYDHYVAKDACASDGFKCVAWVEAAGGNDKTALLGKILQKVEADLAKRASLTAWAGKIIQKKIATVQAGLVSSEGDGNAVSEKLRSILAKNRYLVFLDDVQQSIVLEDLIKYHFPENAKSGMVIVTTSVRQVANVCSHGSYVYTMECLGNNDSQDLLNKIARDDVRGNVDDSTSIITKIGGLPLALISVVEHLNRNHTIADRVYFLKVVKELGSHVAGSSNTKEREFMKLRKAFGQCYEGLPGYNHKTYMRSLSIFPRNHSIKFNGLVRRLVAEGLVADYDRKYLDELVNRCIVNPVQTSSRYNYLRSCQVNVGIMLEFIIYKSLSTNFVTLIREKEVLHNENGSIRRLSVQSSTRSKFEEVEHQNKMSKTIRSLTIIPSQETRELSKKVIKSCKFLRVLDLEGCGGLDNKFFKSICELVYLKYLSLRKTDVKMIPAQQIKKLLCLQTLDIRDTQEMGLPEEVITLPELAFLFGKFVLPEMSKDTTEFLETKSKLQTVAGFVVDQGKGSEHIILKAHSLIKVKVWCRDTSNNDFVSSLQTCFTSLDSVSIQSDQLSPESVPEGRPIIASLDAFVPDGRPCTISRMKLLGKLNGLPEVIARLQMIDNLNKLQLSYTELTIEVLSTLQDIRHLQYLKLHDKKQGSWDGKFHVLEGGFKRLLLLCFDAPKLPKLQFDTGSMESLTSLYLFCGDAEEISKSIKHIKNLSEVILRKSDTLTEAVVDAWKTAAMSNPNRPCVTTSTCS